MAVMAFGFMMVYNQRVCRDSRHPVRRYEYGTVLMH